MRVVHGKGIDSRIRNIQRTVRPNPAKIKALLERKSPRNIKEVRIFNGMSGQYQKYIKNYMDIMAPLYALTRKNNPLEWTA